MTPRGTLGIIPARGGSRRVPRKNIRLLAGKPLIAYTIEAARAATTLDRVIVSTDDEEIAGVARRYGGEVPFMRPAELAADDTPDAPVFLHALDWLAKEEGFDPELVVNLRPTSPFKTGVVIDEVVEVALETRADVVRTVTRVPPKARPPPAPARTARASLIRPLAARDPNASRDSRDVSFSILKGFFFPQRCGWMRRRA